jgi:hypothetical protein
MVNTKSLNLYSGLNYGLNTINLILNKYAHANIFIYSFKIKNPTMKV